MRKLNLGCGPVQPDGWQNVDGSIRAWVATRVPVFDRLMTRMRIWSETEFNAKTQYANLLRRLPWSDNSVDCVYLGEVLEHFTRNDGSRFLSECYRVLRPGGVIRVRVPDNARFWRNYLNEFDDAFTKPQAEWTDAHDRWVEMFFRNICVRREWLGSFGHYHKWMYDEISLIRTLQRVGFTDLSRRKFLDSTIEDIQQVETHEDLTVEGNKPPAI
jgi:predicted SAM-dependent methyltransferase